MTSEALRSLLKAMFLAGSDTGISLTRDGFDLDEIHSAVEDQFEKRCSINMTSRGIEIIFNHPGAEVQA
jgi:hypothetical protein